MNILITGNLHSFAPTLAQELAKEKNKVVLAGDKAEDLGQTNIKNVIFHSINPAETIFQDAVSSYKFDVVIFFSTREEEFSSENNNIGLQLDGLRNTLELASNEKVKRFVYISSTEVYGNMLDSSETVEPQPSSINGLTLLTGEQYCLVHYNKFDLNVTIVRLPFIYMPGDKQGMLYRLITNCISHDKVTFPINENSLCSFLHVTDVLDFVTRVLDEDHVRDSQVLNLSSTNPFSYLKLSELLKKHFPKVEFEFNDTSQIYTRAANVGIAKKVYDWVDLHDVSIDLDEYIDLLRAGEVYAERGFRSFINRLADYSGVLRWVELFLGAGLTQYLSQLTGTLIQYKYIDFRLLFVIIMGSLYGFRFGVYAAFLISLSLFYTWHQLAIDWTLLIYNVGNWFPVALYFVAGLFFGYSHDRTETMIANLEKQISLIFEKYKFLYDVFNEIRRLKDEFREQVIGYRDSFGKIFTITRELDALQEHMVYFRALSILEDLMENGNIAIYSLNQDSVYARLEVSSISLSYKLAKSLKLTDYPEALKSIEQGTIFQNTLLLPNYPAYIAPVLNNSYPFNVPVAIVVIWSVKFEQYSTYYYNLFKVISGLIQASLLRATKFLDANYEKTYIPSTRILNSEAFADIVKTRVEMMKNGVAQYQLIQIENTETDLQDLYSKINEGIRTTDIVGLQKDGHCYVLLSQADISDAKSVMERFERLGLGSRLASIDDLSFV